MRNLSIIFIFFTAITFSKTIYVNKDASGDNSGNSWENGFTDLQMAINSASSGDILFVKSGTYYPSHKILNNDDRSKTFYIDKDIKIYGGFNGTETSLSQRDLNSNTSTLSGDFNGNDQDTNSNGIHDFGQGENSYSVVFTYDLGNNASLDGFKITGGNADGSTDYTFNGYSLDTSHGGGIYNVSSNLTLRNIKFINNSASLGGAIFNKGDCFSKLENSIMQYNFASFGAGMYTTDASLITITNSDFYQNRFSGGVIFTTNNSAIKATNCVFNNNSGSSGGAFYTRTGSNITLLNVKIFNNTMSGSGGAIYNANYGSTTMYNTLIYGNSADFGGAIYTASNAYTSAINCTIYGNSASNKGGAYYCRISPDGMNAKMYNTIVWGNTAPSNPNFFYEFFTRSDIHVKNSILQGSGGSNNWNTYFGEDENNNLDVDPIFTNTNQNSEDFTLKANSQGINASYNQFLTLPNGNNSWQESDFDVYGNSRLVSNGVDIGAIENNAILAANNLQQEELSFYYQSGFLLFENFSLIKGKEILIYDITGKIIFKTKANKNNIKVKLSKNLYILKIDKYKAQKFVVAKT